MHHTIPLVLVTALAIGATNPAVADDDDEVHRYSANSPTWKAECGSCHIAYPPQLLPARSWRAIMAGLDKHFGTDASLDPQAAAEISAFLERNAGRERTPSARPVLRISETRWFAHEHDEVPASTWQSATVNSPSNCTACHVNADQGDYSERGIRIPK
jgi:nitrate/TMAO reductase-like tetraheme cytochrome c subunit